MRPCILCNELVRFVGGGCDLVLRRCSVVTVSDVVKDRLSNLLCQTDREIPEVFAFTCAYMYFVNVLLHSISVIWKLCHCGSGRVTK